MQGGKESEWEILHTNNTQADRQTDTVIDKQQTDRHIDLIVRNLDVFILQGRLP